MALRDLALQKKMLIAFLVTSLIPMIVLSSLFYTVSRSLLYQNANETAEVIIDRVAAELDLLLGESLELAASLAENSIIQRALEVNFSPEDVQYQLSRAAGRELLQVARARVPASTIYILGENGVFLSTAEIDLELNEYRNSYWYREILQNAFPPVLFPPHDGSYMNPEAGESLISLGFPIRDSISNARSGVVLLDLEERAVKDILTERLGSTGYLFVQYGRSGFTSSHDQAPDSDYLVRLANNSEISKELLAQKRELVILRNLEIGGFKLAAVIDLDILYQDSQFVGMIILITLMVTLGLVLFSAFWLSSSISGPILHLQELMSQAEAGDLMVRMRIPTGDTEIAQLARGFNRMIERIGTLLENIREDQVQLRKAELETLQAQINPHFLYNTLDSINWLSRDGRGDEIPELVSSLTTLFRKGISRGRELITVQDEIAHVESYLRIQSIRYRELIRYSVDAAPEAQMLYVPKIILQPLVENAIYHGLRKKGDPGTISIRCRCSRRYLLFEVEDTGLGMDEARIRGLEQRLAGDVNAPVESFGLLNVAERIRILCGDEYGLKIRSRLHEGTRVLLTLPLDLNEEAQ